MSPKLKSALLETHECVHPFGLFLGGFEAPSWTKVLRETEGVHVGLSYMSLRPRIPKTKQYLLAERFEPRFEILIDSGGFGADKREEFDHQDHILKYTEWVEQNIDRITLVTEYDVPSLGLEWVHYWRDRFWNKIPVQKFVPVWHEEYGALELDQLCDNYARVGVVKPENTSIEARLRNLVAQTGVKLHGVGITGPDTLARVPFTTVSSTSWLSPSKNGEFHCWSSGKLNWYPRASASSQRTLHRADVERAGFDPDLVEIGENSSINRYSAWVWRQYEKQLAERAATRSGTAMSVTHREDGEVSEGEIVTHRAPRNSTNLPAVRRDRIMIPGLQMKPVETTNVQGDGYKTVEIPTMSEDILRVCNSCSYQNVCFKFEAGASCAFKLPVSMRTIEELRGWASMMIETQAQRVFMLRMGEEMSGGAPDAALSAELDRMSKLLLQYKELFEEGFTLSLQVKGHGAAGAGVLSKMFGADVGETNREANSAIEPEAAESVVAKFIDVEAL